MPFDYTQGNDELRGSDTGLIIREHTNFRSSKSAGFLKQEASCILQKLSENLFSLLCYQITGRLKETPEFSSLNIVRIDLC